MKRSSRSAGPRRRLLWIRDTTSQLNTAAPFVLTGQPLLLGEGALGHDLVGATIVRIRGTWTVRTYGNVAGASVVEAYLGFITSSVPFSEVASQSPKPYTDRQSSWMGWDAIHIPKPLAAAVGDSSSETIVRKDFDFTAKRVLRQINDTLISAVEIRAGASNSDILVTTSIALLLP